MTARDMNACDIVSDKKAMASLHAVRPNQLTRAALIKSSEDAAALMMKMNVKTLRSIRAHREDDELSQDRCVCASDSSPKQKRKIFRVLLPIQVRRFLMHHSPIPPTSTAQDAKHSGDPPSIYGMAIKNASVCYNTECRKIQLLQQK